MAASEPVKAIKAEVTCSICLQLFQDPVTTECGHSFCKPCITQHCEERESSTLCPQCKRTLHKENLRANRELKNIVESINQLSGLQREEESGRISQCQKHQEPLKLYCKNDQCPICVICRESQAHFTHTVVPMEEAVQEHREKITDQLDIIEHSCEKLHQLVTQLWKHLPQSEQEEEQKQLKRVADKVAMLLKVDTESHGQR
ncbi:zinc finger protein RFP-like [Pelodiscus sinensis]|uniref:zinc finger protein RFP-like n=1 Tax=Pelodiscus sinensis TaxID=13735 RepID=UPI003F6A8378